MSTTTTSAARGPKTRSARARIHQGGEILGRYTDPRGREREVVRHPGVRGSWLVIDRLAGELTDQRLLAHLAHDEPPENARIVTSLYLADPRGRHCRRLTPEDLTAIPFASESTPAVDAASRPPENGSRELLDERGCRYRLQPECGHTPLPQLRWWRHAPPDAITLAQPVTVREAIGGLESYEPVRTLTAAALARHKNAPSVSTTVLRAELERTNVSPIVLNRGLREAVLAAVTNGLSMSEIAMRCGRAKRDAKGNHSGETSWLSRRIGILPDGGKNTPTPWVSSDVLALIARDGLGIAPREAELG
jgi:hypothetical protein